jgi:hypothetical protein
MDVSDDGDEPPVTRSDDEAERDRGLTKSQVCCGIAC